MRYQIYDKIVTLIFIVIFKIFEIIQNIQKCRLEENNIDFTR
ncbi:hypothetical protein SCAPIOD220019 [Staphylococcus capitis]|nr:hypothetical protein CR01_40013 [Staphylococcus capitis CR01]CQD27590.1 hypothetical protein SCAPIOD190013 [Staphylococcus capitis]CQD28226.1 hypothetical protein SCAPIOD220019 [Staphylococcus capitis]CQD31358.1 hypothetical protein SCAPIOD20035 [Staphylococcus capitis]CRN11746.1 hypothetical protein BN151730172 [Staphylococcus capitis]